MTDSLREALAPLAEAFEADGYHATYSVTQGKLLFDITAGENACAECLTPPEVMEAIIRHALEQQGLRLEIDLKYPAGAEHAQ